MNLDEIAIKFGTDKSSLGHNYMSFYETEFSSLKLEIRKILEIGVYKGASLETWSEAFPKSEVWGIDIDPKTKKFEKDRIIVRVGDQTDENFLQSVVDEVGQFDIIVDDGSHFSEDQIKSLEFLFPYVSLGGLYVIEDLQTSYEKNFVRGNVVSCMDYLKCLIGHLKRKSSIRKKHQKKCSNFERHMRSISFYPNIAFIRKSMEPKF